MGIKLAIVGAGSSYCPELMQGLIRRKDKITLDELRLSDIDESRLSIVGDFCERVLSENGIEPRITRTTDLPRALDGAATGFARAEAAVVDAPDGVFDVV